MTPMCLFCDNPAGSREHIWPDWIHKRKKFGPIKHKIGDSEQKILPNPEQKVRTICGECNNGWMSKLEEAAIPVVGSMFADIAMPLNNEQRRLIAVWGLKMSMIVDSVQGRNPEARFFKRDECEDLRLSGAIPDRTRIWIGHLAGHSLAAYGTHIGVFVPEIPARVEGIVVNIVVGHLVMQVLTLHAHPGHSDANIPYPEPKPGDWDRLLMQIWPIRDSVELWPPKLSFTYQGSHSIETVLDRFRRGDELPHRRNLKVNNPI